VGGIAPLIRNLGTEGMLVVGLRAAWC